MFSKVLVYLKKQFESPSGRAERRRNEHRLPLRRDLFCHHDGHRFPVQMMDFSPGGVRLTLHRQRVRVEDTISIVASGCNQRAGGRVAWVRGKYPHLEVGVQFHQSDQNCIEEWSRCAQRNQPFPKN